MKIMILTDMEGISGIFLPQQVIDGESRYQEGREYLTREINICAKALKDSKVNEIYVWDGHGGGKNIIWDKLSADIDNCLSGQLCEKGWELLRECDGVIFLGWHAMAGTKDAILEHTMSSKEIQNIFVDDMPYGEIALNAAAAGEMETPVIMVSGDDKTCMEADKFLPWAVKAEVKKGTGCFGGICLAPDKAEKVIYEKTAEAIKTISDMKVFKLAQEVTLRVELVERCQMTCEKVKPYIKIIDARTYEVTASNMNEALLRVFS